MSKEVERFDPFGYDGLSAKMEEHECGDYVRAEDYDALLAERDALKKEIGAVLQEMRERRINRGKNTSPTLHSWADRINAALQGEQP